MASPLKWNITTMTHTHPVVGAVTTAVLAANEGRLYALLENDGTEAIYLKIGAAAVMNQGIRLNASGGMTLLVLEGV